MLINVPLDQIDDNPFQRRQDYGDVADLAADIKANGLLQKPVGRLIYTHGEVITGDAMYGACRRIDEDGFPAGLRVQLAFGHRRLRAFRHLAAGGAGESTMPVYIEEYTDDALLDAVWSENHNRSDINPIEQAELLAEKLERARAAGGNQATVAADWRLDRSTVANKLRLLDLPAEVQAALRERRLSERQALALLPVVELGQKLNGTTAEWADRPNNWRPMAPAAYLAHVVASPDAATSDAIREYTKTAAAHAGKPLTDDLSTFEAGEGKGIVQSTCKGCPKRINQHCLHPPCYDARAKRLLAVLPEWASRETGLPYSENAAEFDLGRDEWESVQADWKAGLAGQPDAHNHLVVSVRGGYFPFRPYSRDYVATGDEINNWRAAIVIGRKTLTAAERDALPATSSAPLRPSPEEVKRWRALAARGDRERVKRTQQALMREIEPLAENEPAMRALMAMLDGRWLAGFDELHRNPSVYEFAGHLMDEAWKRAETWHYGGNNREPMRKILHRAGLSPDIVDQPDQALRLLDIGQMALIEYEEKRNHVGETAMNMRLVLVRDALAEFAAVPHVVAGHDELEQLAAYLRAAIRREENLLAAEGTQ